MTYRPYPNAARARRQLARHTPRTVNARMALAEWSITAEQAAANIAAWTRSLPRTGSFAAVPSRFGRPGAALR